MKSSDEIVKDLIDTSDAGMVRAFEDEVQRVQRESKCSRSDAIKITTHANPALHREYVIASNNLRNKQGRGL